MTDLERTLAEFCAGEEPRTAADDATLDAVMRRWDGRSGQTRRIGVAMAVVAAACGLAWLGSVAWQRDVPVQLAAEPTAVAVVPKEIQPAPPPAPEPVAWSVASGRLQVGDEVLADGSSLQPGELMVVEDATLVRGELRIAAAVATRLDLAADLLRIDEGAVVIEGADALAIRTPRGDLVAHGGPATVRVTDVAVIVEVTAGHVVTTDPTGLVQVIEAGTVHRFEGARGDDGVASPRKESAADLLARAQRERAAGQSAAAVKTYRLLVRRHAGTGEAHSALVSLGQLELDRGHPKRAAQAFGRYLRRGGVLAEEARYGEIRALRDLGRADDEQTAIEEFLRRHPASPHRGSLQRRLGELSR